MPIVDAQVHLWRKGAPTPPHIATPYLVEDAIRGMDEAGVDGAILHPPQVGTRIPTTRRSRP